MFPKKTLLTFILFLVMLSAPSFASVANCTENTCTVDTSSAKDITPQMTLIPHNISAKEVCIVYFYSSSCPHCANLEPFIDSIEDKYKKDIKLMRYDVTIPENMALYNKLCASKNYEGKSIPLAAINDIILVGENDINASLENEILRGIAMDTKICPLEGMQCTAKENKTDNDPLIPQIGEKLEWQAILPLILLTGLADGINPCAFAVLLFIMAFLLQISSSKKRLVKVTTAYILALLSVNILLGILYYYTSIRAGYPELIRTIAISLALFTGLINIKDYFYYGKGITLKIPESSKKHIESLTKKASVPSALVLGSLVALLEAPCSIPIYLTVIEVLKGHGSSLLAIMPYILVYNFMFILPLVILASVIYYGGEAKALEKWRDSHKRTMKLMLGTILILLALSMYFRYI